MITQQGALYKSENDALYDPQFPMTGPLSLEEAQEFVDHMRHHPWWDENFPKVSRVEVYEHAGGDSVGVYYPEMESGVADMSDRHMIQLYLCHEVAHVLAAARYGSRSHDPWFARTYLELVYLNMGSDAYHALYRAFEEHHIEHVIDD